jgi:hypothetical protein
VTDRTPGILGAFGVVAVAAGLVAGATALPSVQRTAGPHRLPISSSTPALVCPGPETLLVPDGGEAADPGAAVLISSLVAAESGPSSGRLTLSGARSSAAAAAARTLPAGLTAASVPITAGENQELSAASGAVIRSLAATALGPALLQVPPGPAENASPEAVAKLAAVQSTLARVGDLRALTATTCTAPASDSWLVGGSTEVGARLRLLLANPTTAAAVVDVDVRGPKGRVRAASGEGVVVPAGGEVPIFVDALAPGLKQVALHITTRSGRVRATLHDSRLHGLNPGGADDVPVTAAPARRQVVPGISLVDGYGPTAGDPSAAGSTAVRIAVPGAEEAVVRVRLLDATGSVELPRSAVVSVPAGGVVDVPIAGIAPGNYTAVLDSDVPVVAGALIGRSSVPGTAAASEIAWAGAVRPLAGSGYLVLPPGARSALSLAATAAAGKLVISEVYRDGTIGKPLAVDVPGGSSATVRLAADAVAVKISEVSAGPIGAAVVCWAPDPRGSLISVLSVDLVAASTPPSSAVQDRTLGLR